MISVAFDDGMISVAFVTYLKRRVAHCYPKHWWTRCNPEYCRYFSTAAWKDLPMQSHVHGQPLFLFLTLFDYHASSSRKYRRWRSACCDHQHHCDKFSKSCKELQETQSEDMRQSSEISGGCNKLYKSQSQDRQVPRDENIWSSQEALRAQSENKTNFWEMRNYRACKKLKNQNRNKFPKDEKLMRFLGTENSMFVEKGFLKLL